MFWYVLLVALVALFLIFFVVPYFRWIAILRAKQKHLKRKWIYDKKKRKI